MELSVGDKIKLKGGDQIGIIAQVSDCFYTINCKNHTHHWSIIKQDDWELIPNKFDINTLKLFDKVLVRNDSSETWHIQFFENYNRQYGAKYPFTCMCDIKYSQCIPFKGNEHLANTANDCCEYFKTWEFCQI